MKAISPYASLDPDYQRARRYKKMGYATPPPRELPLTPQQRMAVYLARMLRYYNAGIRSISNDTLQRYADYINQYWPYERSPLAGEYKGSKEPKLSNNPPVRTEEAVAQLLPVIEDLQQQIAAATPTDTVDAQSQDNIDQMREALRKPRSTRPAVRG